MLSTTVLDTAIGLVFTFLAISLVSSAVTEALASAIKWRSRTLLAGVQALLNDKNFNGLARDLYNHALINPRFGGNATTKGELNRQPAYIDPAHFAAAFTEVAKLTQKAPADIKAEIDKITDPQIKQLLTGIFDRAGGDLAKMRNEIATWFDSCMDRVSGAYKRDAQMVTFAIALAIAAVLNVSAVRVAMALWSQPALAKSITANNPGSSVEALRDLEALDLPIGWPSPRGDKPAVGDPVHDSIFAGLSGPALRAHGCGWWVTTILGWFITAGATLFGAAFWFDSLQQFVRLKGTGPSPADKAQNKAAST